MKLYRNLALSRRALGARKLRSALGLLGLSIGVAALITVRSLGEGAEREALARIESMGTNLLVVQAAPAPAVAGRARQESLATTLSLDDARAIAERCPSLAAAAPAVETVLSVKYGDAMTRTMILGSTSEYARVSNSRIARGRLFTLDEEESSARVAVLGHQAASSLFPPGQGADPVGETVRLGNIPFTVVGVLAEKGSSPDGANEDDKILVPIRTAMRRVMNTDYIKAVFTSVRRRENLLQAEREIGALLRERHRLEPLRRPDDFTMRSQAGALKAAREASRAFTTLGSWVGAVSVAVGGVGILSLMLLLVKERTPEIGLRMAVGSRPRDILVQFLFESLALGLSGGVAGWLLGMGAAVAIGAFTRWDTAISAGSALLATGISIVTGLVFGAYPARRAASLDPVVALAAE